jgi:hypothetical protein
MRKARKPMRIKASAPRPPPKPALRCEEFGDELDVSSGATVAVGDADADVLVVVLVGVAVLELLLFALELLLVVLALEVCEELVLWVELVVVGVELVGMDTTVAVLLNPVTPIIVCAGPAGISNVPAPVRQLQLPSAKSSPQHQLPLPQSCRLSSDGASIFEYQCPSFATITLFHRTV